MYTSVYDKQTGRYMCTGLNSNTEAEAVEDIFEYLMTDTEEEDVKAMENWSIEKKKEYAELNEFEFQQHEEKMEEES